MILITGGAGQLAKEFQRFFKKNSIDFLVPNRLELDIIDFDKVRDYILKNDIELVLNCAAYNLVDKAVTDIIDCKILLEKPVNFRERRMLDFLKKIL